MNFADVYNITIKKFSDNQLITWFSRQKANVIRGNDYEKMIDSIAAELEERFCNIEKGEWIGLKSDNHYLWFATFFALLKIGYPVLLLTPSTDEVAAKSFLEQANLKAIITDNVENYYSIINIPIKELENCSKKEPNTIYWEDRIAFCTSGTIGKAKIYVYHAEAIYTQCTNISKFLLDDERIVKLYTKEGPANNPSLLTLPLAHCMGFGIVLGFWTAGFPLVLPEKPGIFGIAETCKKYGIWFFCSVPVVWKSLIKIAEMRYGNSKKDSMKKLLGENFSASVCAGAKVDKSLVEKLRETGIYIVNGWGMTETSFVTMGPIEEDESADYVGIPYNGHKMIVIDPKDGNIRDEGFGEIGIKGKVMYSAMLSNGKEIPRNPEEYYRTGDLLEIRGNRLYFKGRCKSVIISDTGENIYPEELEMYFSFLENYVEQYCVVEHYGEPALFLRTNDVVDFERTEIFEKLVDTNNQLPYGKRIKRIFSTNQIMPMTIKGETSRFFLADFLRKNKTQIRELLVTK